MTSKLNRACALLLVSSTLLSGCSMLTAQGRRERAYERYVAKYSHRRTKQQSLFASLKLPKLHSNNAPVIAAESSGPVSVSDGTEQ